MVQSVMCYHICTRSLLTFPKPMIKIKIKNNKEQEWHCILVIPALESWGQANLWGSLSSRPSLFVDNAYVRTPEVILWPPHMAYTHTCIPKN